MPGATTTAITTAKAMSADTITGKITTAGITMVRAMSAAITTAMKAVAVITESNLFSPSVRSSGLRMHGQKDFVFITGMTLTNKTLPRLLTLTESAKTILVGPSSPITPLLFRYGVDSIAGFYVTDRELTRALAAQAAHREIFRGGRRIVYSK